MAHGDAREGRWRGNWRMKWVASTLTLPRNVVYPALLPLMRTPRLSAVDRTDAPADLNGLVRFGERRNLVSAHVPSHFKRTITTNNSYRRCNLFVKSVEKSLWLFFVYGLNINPPLPPPRLMRNDQQLFAFKIMTLFSSLVKVQSFSNIMVFHKVFSEYKTSRWI